jgi:mannan endo-1,4-beta-mannosidase
MSSNRLRLRATVAVAAAAGLLLIAGCGANSGTSVARVQTHIVPADNPGFKIDKNALLHPARKYFGISLAGVPQSVTTPITQIKQETGKRPNLAMYYLDWGAGSTAGTPNFRPRYAENACAAGMLPMLTWESWDTTKTTPGQGVSYTQPAFDMNKIIAGDFDPYIRATAQAIASIGCPIAVRLDQEPNGYWYPWGVTNTMEYPSGSAAAATLYVEMWRHVVRIFRAQQATNVLWTWSPNIQTAKAATTLPLSEIYPGKSWVNWVGIDGYYNTPTRTFANLIVPTENQLKTVAPDKAWILAETGVGSTSKKPAQIKNLLDSVATDKQLDGLVYFEQHKSTDRNFWPFVDPSHPNSVKAFKTGIDQKAYAAGKPGDSWFQ